MRKGKNRYNPDKPQNNYGGDEDCPNYDNYYDGTEFCHDEQSSGWNEYIQWKQKDKDGKLICKGNRHNCNKLRLKWLASLSEEERKKYLEKFGN
jgi:hypothetical protein